MAASTTSDVTGEAGARRSSSRSSTVVLLTVGLSISLVLLLVTDATSFAEDLREHWPALLFWGMLILIVNLFPVIVGDLQLTLDAPLMLACSFLYSPQVAAFVALIAAVDIREIRREVGPTRAIFNRVQMALSMYLASLVFHTIVHDLRNWRTAIVGTGISLGAHYFVNSALVASFVRLSAETRFRFALKRLRVGRIGEYSATYLGYGFLALVLARLFVDVGAWSVATFLVPTLVARMSLVRTQQLGLLAQELRQRERLLEVLSDRIVDERKDERLRIAADLHDDVLQRLIDVLFLSRPKRAERSNKSAMSFTAAVDAGELTASAESAIDALRQVILDLKESPLGRGGLIPTLDGLIREFRLDWKKRIWFETLGKVDVRPEEQVAAYQVAREALLNALKHSRSEQIWVRLAATDQGLIVIVEDDGAGFEPEAVDPSAHFGLGLMRERLRMVGGRLDIETGLGQGTRLTASLPAEVHSP